MKRNPSRPDCGVLSAEAYPEKDKYDEQFFNKIVVRTF